MTDERIKFLREKSMKLPMLPGVYIMRSKSGEIIYVGKQKSSKIVFRSIFKTEKRIIKPSV